MPTPGPGSGVSSTKTKVWEVIVGRRGAGQWILGGSGPTSQEQWAHGLQPELVTCWQMSGLLDGLEIGSLQVLPSGLVSGVDTSSLLRVTATLLLGYCGSLGMGFTGVKQGAFYLPWDGWDINRSCMN